MSGNEFLKHSPHKNRGDIPFGAYARMRFQMEAAKIPYMKRTLPGGILEVQKIYGTQWKVDWTPTGGVEVCYTVMYIKDLTGNRTNLQTRIIFYDSELIKLRDCLITDVPSGLLVEAHEFKVNDDLICMLFYTNPSLPSEMKYGRINVVFYCSATGERLDYVLSLYNYYLTYGTRLGWPTSIPFYNVPSSSNNIPSLTVWCENGKVYVFIKNKIYKLTPIKDEDTGVYSVAETIIYVSGITLGGLCCEEGVLFYIDGPAEGPRVVILDKDTGGVIDTRISVPGVAYWRTPASYTDYTTSPYSSVLPFGTVYGGGLTSVRQTVFGRCFYGINALAHAYDKDGNIVDGAPSMAEWRGFGELNAVLWQGMYSQGYTTDVIRFGNVDNFMSEENPPELLTKQQLYEMLSVPEDALAMTPSEESNRIFGYPVFTFNYFPGLGNNPAIAGLLGVQ